MAKDASEGVSRTRTYDDEISLVDLWLVLVKQKWVITCVLLICVSVVGVALLAEKDRYSYISVVKPGSSISQGGGGADSESRKVLVEPVEATLSKLNKIFIPFVLNSRHEESDAIEIKAYIPSNSQVIMVESVSSLALEYQRAIHEKIEVLLQKDQESQLAVWRRAVEHEIAAQGITLRALQAPVLLLNKKQAILNQLEKINIELERLQAPYAILTKEKQVKENLESAELTLSRLAREEILIAKKQTQLVVEQGLLEREISDLAQQLEQALQRSLEVGAKASGGMDGIALLLIDNVIQGNRSRLALLEHRLQIELPERALVLKNSQHGTRRAQLLEKNKIAFLKEELEQVKIKHQRELITTRLPVEKLQLELQVLDANHARSIETKLLLLKQLNNQLLTIDETRLLVPPVYAGVVVVDLIKIALLTVIAGLVLGVFAAFIWEFLSAARRRQGESDDSPNAKAVDASEEYIVSSVPTAHYGSVSN